MTFDPALVQALIGLAGAPFVAALTELIKRTFPELRERWYPLVAVIWGLVLNLGWAAVEIYSGMTQQNRVVVLAVALILGLMAGLSASGLYSGAKAQREPS